MCVIYTLQFISYLGTNYTIHPNILYERGQHKNIESTYLEWWLAGYPKDDLLFLRHFPSFYFTHCNHPATKQFNCPWCITRKVYYFIKLSRAQK